MASAIGGSFVPALNAEAIMDSTFQFNYYDGGGLDIAFLGIGQVDAEGNLNVSKFAKEWNGPGGFINITDQTPRIVFCGTLTTGGLKVEVNNGKIKILEEGRFNKFVEKVEQITFNGKRGVKKGQKVLYVTERAVFQLRESGPELIEIAPGIDVARDIQPHVSFELKIADNVRSMPPETFSDTPLELSRRFDEMST
jgi:acyl CoA:acetate/3-ketoacid CoA transferase